jgi:hypothetical protein
MIKILAKLFGSGILDRILDTVDKKVQSETDREKIKGDIIREHYSSRAGFMKAGGFFLMALFAVPLAFWFSSVVLYSVLWCSRCAYPQQWTIAALPPPLDEWSGMMIVSLFGLVGFGFRSK